MAEMLANRVIEYCSTLGQATFELSGAVPNARTFSSKIATGKTVTYWARRRTDHSKWEHGRGVLNTSVSPHTLTRVEVFDSSDGTTKISWEAADAPYIIYLFPDLLLMDGLLTENLADAAPTWLPAGGKWTDKSAGIAVRWIRKLRKTFDTPASDVELGRFEVADNIYVPSPRRPFTAVGAANKIIATTDIGRRFTLDNSAAARSVTLPAGSSVEVGFTFDFYGTSNATLLSLIPNGSNQIDHLGNVTVKLPGMTWITVFWDGTVWRTTYHYTGLNKLLDFAPSAVATLADAQGLPTWVNKLRIEWEITVTTDNTFPRMQTYDSGGSLSVGGSDYESHNLAADSVGTVAASYGSGTSIALAGSGIDQNTNGAFGSNGILELIGMQNTTRWKHFHGHYQWLDQAGALVYQTTIAARRRATGAISGFQIAMSSSTGSGAIRVYGST